MATRLSENELLEWRSATDAFEEAAEAAQQAQSAAQVLHSKLGRALRNARISHGASDTQVPSLASGEWIEAPQQQGQAPQGPPAAPPPPLVPERHPEVVKLMKRGRR